MSYFFFQFVFFYFLVFLKNKFSWSKNNKTFSVKKISIKSQILLELLQS